MIRDKILELEALLILFLQEVNDRSPIRALIITTYFEIFTTRFEEIMELNHGQCKECPHFF